MSSLSPDSWSVSPAFCHLQHVLLRVPERGVNDRDILKCLFSGEGSECFGCGGIRATGEEFPEGTEVGQ